MSLFRDFFEEEQGVDSSSMHKGEMGDTNSPTVNKMSNFTYDSSKPYAGVVDHIWGTPKLNNKGLNKNDRIIVTHGLADMLRLVSEAVVGSMGGDIIKRGRSRVAEEAAKNNGQIMNIFSKEKNRYNAMRMSQVLKNIDYGIRQKEREGDRKWKEGLWNDHFSKQEKAAKVRMEKQFEHSDDQLKKTQSFQKAMFDKRVAEQKLNAAGKVKKTEKPYLQIMGDDGIPVNLNQAQYNYILAEIIKDPEIKKTLSGLSVASDSYSKNRLNVIIQEHAKKYFDLKDGTATQRENKYNTGGLY